MAVFVDWDCTITSQHMFSMLQSPKSAESSEFLQSLATEEERRAYWAFQQRNVFHYRGWGRKDASSLEACKAQALAPHVDLFPPQFECIKKQLKDYLFGGDARLEAITRTLVQLNSHARQGMFILTKGIGSYVLAVVRSLAAHWIALLPGLLVVDYTGHMYSLAPGSEPFRGSTFPVDHKIPQMLGVFAATQQPIPAFILLIDDGYEGELRHVPKDAEVETKQGAVSGQGFWGDALAWGGSGSGGVRAAGSLSGGPLVALSLLLPPLAPSLTPPSVAAEAPASAPSAATVPVAGPLMLAATRVRLAMSGPAKNAAGLTADDLRRIESEILPLLRQS